MTYQVPRRLAWNIPERGDDDPLVVYLMPLPDGPPLVLRGIAGLIWALAIDGEQDVPAAVAELLDQPLEEVRPVTLEFLADLVARGLLAPPG